MSSWTHARVSHAQAFVQFRADQASSCAYKLRNSGGGSAPLPHRSPPLQALGKGDRVMVTGRLRQRSWETPDGTLDETRAALCGCGKTSPSRSVTAPAASISNTQAGKGPCVRQGALNRAGCRRDGYNIPPRAPPPGDCLR
jgi:hypothetical protein